MILSQQLDQPLPPFDELVYLAKHNPDAFSQFKHDMCEDMICSASHVMQDRLRAQQSHIDLVISRCKNPDHINVVLMQELSCQVFKFKEVLDGDSYDVEPSSATVIPFKLRQ